MLHTCRGPGMSKVVMSCSTCGSVRLAYLSSLIPSSLGKEHQNRTEITFIRVITCLRSTITGKYTKNAIKSAIFSRDQARIWSHVRTSAVQCLGHRLFALCLLINPTEQKGSWWGKNINCHHRDTDFKLSNINNSTQTNCELWFVKICYMLMYSRSHKWDVKVI